jgi:hypothetical protein
MPARKWSPSQSNKSYLKGGLKLLQPRQKRVNIDRNLSCHLMETKQSSSKCASRYDTMYKLPRAADTSKNVRLKGLNHLATFVLSTQVLVQRSPVGEVRNGDSASPSGKEGLATTAFLNRPTRLTRELCYQSAQPILGAVIQVFVSDEQSFVVVPSAGSRRHKLDAILRIRPKID